MARSKERIRTQKVARDSGVYAIVCQPTGWRYVGGTYDCQQRWWNHLAKLRWGKHTCKELQADWERFGEAAFGFTILESVWREGASRENLTPSEYMNNYLQAISGLAAREQYWLDRCRGEGTCYNLTLVVRSNWW